MQWLAPWHSVADDSAQVSGMEQELQRELSLGHPLFGIPVRTVARRQDCDDVLFALEDGTGRVAVVHLTWTKTSPERLPWPVTRLFASLSDWKTECMQVDAAEFDS